MLVKHRPATLIELQWPVDSKLGFLLMWEDRCR